MRDQLMDEEYFEKYIENEVMDIDEMEEWLRNGEVKQERISSIKAWIWYGKFNAFEAKYSAGYDVADLEQDVRDNIIEMPQHWKEFSNYTDVVIRMSLAIMMELEPEVFEIAAGLAEKDKFHDALLDFFIHYKRTGEIKLTNREFYYGSPYTRLADIIEGNGDREALLRDYVKKYWYRGHKQESWWGIHKEYEKDGEMLYSGYWSYEAGALAKILKIPDESLKNQKYYPYDLAHYKD